MSQGFVNAQNIALPLVVAQGGTGLTAAGTSGNVLTSNGTNWTSSSLGVSRVVQRVSTQTGTVATGTTTIPIDNTIPQNTEGDQYMSLAITPSNTANILQITTVVVYACNATAPIMALFQDTTAGALSAVSTSDPDVNAIRVATFIHTMTAGTTSSTTFKIRMGGQSGTFTFNGALGSQYMGGVYASSMSIIEFTS